MQLWPSSRAQMTSAINGDFEHAIPPTFAPKVGATIKRGNELWTITRIEDRLPRVMYVDHLDVPATDPAAKH